MIAASNNDQNVLHSYAVIDGDAHYVEPPDLWTSRVPDSMKDRVPHVRRVDGRDRWFIDGDQDFGPVGLCIIDRDGVKHREIGGGSLATFDELIDAAMSASARVKLMDKLGLWAQVVYPNTAGLSSSSLVTRVDNNELRLLCMKIFNDAIADWQAESGERLLPQALLPVWDKVEMVKEAQRCVEELNLRGFAVADKPERLGLPSYMDPSTEGPKVSDHWAGLLDFCSQTSTPLDFHIGGDLDRGGKSISERRRERDAQLAKSPLDMGGAPPLGSGTGLQPWECFGPESAVAILAAIASMGNAITIANFLYSGIFDVFPGLKLVSVESGIGWIPYLLEALEYQLDEMMPNESKRLQRRPAEYFRDHFYATWWFEDFAPTNIERLNIANNVLFETDFPHPTCLFPHADRIEALAEKWPKEIARRVLQDNAAELYKIRLPTAANL